MIFNIFFLPATGHCLNTGHYSVLSINARLSTFELIVRRALF